MSPQLNQSNQGKDRDFFMNLLEENKLKQISLQQEVDKLQNLLKLFIYSTSHDLRGPILTIKGLVYLMKIEESNDKKNDYMEMIHQVIDRYDLCLQNYRELLQENKLEMHIEEVDFRSIVQEIFQSLSYLDKNNQVVKSLLISPFQSSFKTDVAYLKIILQNLISNALKFQRDGEEYKMIELDINIDDNKCLIKVNDNGIGISPIVEENMFKMFYRGTDHNHGPGLGLYIVKKLVQSMNGQINLVREVGNQTCFLLELPNNKI